MFLGRRWNWLQLCLSESKPKLLDAILNERPWVDWVASPTTPSEPLLSARQALPCAWLYTFTCGVPSFTWFASALSRHVCTVRLSLAFARCPWHKVTLASMEKFEIMVAASTPFDHMGSSSTPPSKNKSEALNVAKINNVCIDS